MKISKITIGIVILIIIFICYKYYQIIKLEYFGNELMQSQNIALPNGTWKRDCEVVSYQYPVLWATCNDDLGKPRDTSIDLTTCPEFVHTDTDSKDPLHKYLDRNNVKPESLCNQLPHQHRLKVENGELKCEYSAIS
jgi:hypothetical protein